MPWWWWFTLLVVCPGGIAWCVSTMRWLKRTETEMDRMNEEWRRAVKRDTVMVISLSPRARWVGEHEEF